MSDDSYSETIFRIVNFREETQLLLTGTDHQQTQVLIHVTIFQIRCWIPVMEGQNK